MGLLDKLKKKGADAAEAKKRGRKVMVIGLDCAPVSYTHLTLPTTPYV